MRWSVLSKLGARAQIENESIAFVGGATVTVDHDTYTPVMAFDLLTSVSTIVYVAWETDSVHVVTSRGDRATLAPKAEGKWTLAIASSGPGLFIAGWLVPGRAHVDRVELDVRTGLIVRPLPALSIPIGNTLIDMDAAGEVRTGDGDAYPGSGYDIKPFTRAGLTIPLVYWLDVNGRIVGVDGRSDAPNQVLLADSDGWYTVTTDPQSALFPPRIDMNGNVATFEGAYITNEDIRSRPIAVDPNGPRIPVYVVTAGVLSAASERITTAIRSALSGENVQTVILIAGVLLIGAVLLFTSEGS